jgi:hypothetical protein
LGLTQKISAFVHFSASVISWTVLYPAAVFGYAFSAAACIIFSNKSLISVGSGAGLTES